VTVAVLLTTPEAAGGFVISMMGALAPNTTVRPALIVSAVVVLDHTPFARLSTDPEEE
jgi:hypothetical protein